MKPISWTDNLVDASPLSSIFGTEVPTLNDIDLHEVRLHRDGPRVLLRFDMRDFPARPPQKWIKAGFDRVQIQLIAIGVQSVKISGLQSTIKIDLNIFREEKAVRMTADNGSFKLELTAAALLVEGVSAYLQAAID